LVRHRTDGSPGPTARTFSRKAELGPNLSTMPPKRGQGGSAAMNAANLQEGAEEEPLQAVILADSFNKRFQVLCVDRPRCLLPLLGVPLLAWTLESLSLSNVKDVIVFCGVHAEDIKEWVT
jgi:translation initiation factor eIF-2B subunit epsilon